MVVQVAPDRRQSLGKRGEDLAGRELRRLGYEILARRYRTRVGEIDIVARHGPTIVFVEVKTRTDDKFGGAASAVTPDKQRRIGVMALDYLSRHRLHDAPSRFDVVAIDYGRTRPRVEVYASAFVLDGRR